MSEKILLGYVVGTAEPVYIPLHHLVITGMTQLSGKTTTIEALIHRSGVRAVVFKTKRGEKGFEMAGKKLPLYFKERSDWRYVSSLIEATLREKVKFERSWVIRACRGTHTLREVYDRVIEFLERKKLRALDRSIFTNLQAYLELILPEIERLPTTDKIEIGPGVNVMDLEAIYHRPEVQALLIRSVMEHILEKEQEIIVVVPECWKFLPQGRNTPVKVFFERFIREGASVGNYLWLDSQDIAGVDKTPLRQVDNWILGRQRETHEVDRTIDAIPLPKSQKPKALEIRRLKLGHFYAACGDEVKLVYVLPAELNEEVGKAVALGEVSPGHVKEMLERLRSEKEVDDELVWKEKYESTVEELNKVRIELENLEQKKGELEELVKVTRKNFDAEMKRVDELAKEREDLKGRLAVLEPLEDLRKAFMKILPSAGVAVAPKKGKITMEHKELVVNVVDVGEKEVKMSTSNKEGQILYCALKDLPTEGWTTSKMNKALNERGWPVKSSTLSAKLSILTGKALLIKTEKGYRLPSKVKFNVSKA